MTPFWKRVRHRVEWIFVRLGAAITPLFPRRVAEGVGWSFGWLASFLDRNGRRVALSNLEHAFGAALTPAERKKIVRQSYQHLGRAMTDLFWSPSLTKENFSRYIDVVNLEIVQQAMKTGKGIIFACFHYSNFEWVAIAANYFGVESALVAQEFKNPLLDEIFVGLRESSGQRVIPRDGGVIRLFKTVQRGGHVAILTDLTISARLPTVVIDCFGLKTSVTFAHAWAYRRAGARIINVHCEPLPGGRYRVVFHPQIEFPAEATFQEIAQACWHQFEPVVRKNPAPWMWMYKHWRYRPASAKPEAYPFYANESPHFEKRLAEMQPDLAAR